METRKAAKPTWADKDLSAVMEKLAKAQASEGDLARGGRRYCAQVTNFTDLREALYSTATA